MGRRSMRAVFVLLLAVAFLGCNGESQSFTEGENAQGDGGIDHLGDIFDTDEDDDSDGNSGTFDTGEDTDIDTDVYTGTTDDDTHSGDDGAGAPGGSTPLSPGVDPGTAGECGEGTPSGIPSRVIRQEVECFYSVDDPTVPAASIEQIVEVVEDTQWVHLRLTLDPRFVDNSFGENAVGWENSKKGEHKFKDLVGSDHAEILLYDSDGNLILHFKMDYISEDEDSPSGYGTMGVDDGDGKMIEGEASDILGVATSLDRNLNGCGLDEYVEDSPETDGSHTLSQDAADWDFRVVYEVWVDATVFGAAGFGKAVIENVHASPSKHEDNTIEVFLGECPPCDPDVEECDPWDYCDPEVEECDPDQPDPGDDETDTDDDPIMV